MQAAIAGGSSDVGQGPERLGARTAGRR
jgi:hypothetical protein